MKQIKVEKINGKEYAVWKVYHTLANYEDLRNFMNTNISGEPFYITDFHWTLVHEDEYEILKQGIELFGYEEVFMKLAENAALLGYEFVKEEDEDEGEYS